ncbi:MAG: aminomethyl-transferring glycine dehydrogenase subunit GcvPB [Lachnospiraceae bacterium]|nr:aminomethyl-transferring glycine dehydrogenase subunit GcvPB [Lachnospiraceae bacterium]
MKTVFEWGAPGRRCTILPALDVEEVLPKAPFRETAPRLPELSETEVSRHYTELAEQVFGVNDGFYPLGSCTMKYNPSVNEEMCSLPGFTGVHPLQEDATVQGCLRVLKTAEEYLCAVTGMDAVTFQPAAGAHGEFTGLLLIKAYHTERKDTKRTKVIVPDSAHGTNPATATMCGYEVINLPSGADGLVDLAALKAAVGEDTAGLMLTNPNTCGLFEKDILEITKIVHEAGGLVYYDGANLNGIIGVARPGDMGFDCVHMNLHKTFSTPHGGGGPGSGPVGCKAFLAKYLPGHAVSGDGELRRTRAEMSLGDMRAFDGNFLVVVRALTYLLMLGREGLPEISKNAVLNANYMMEQLKDVYPMAFDKNVYHEFVITMEKSAKNGGVSAMDIAKTLLDHGMHPPTMYFPLIVHEALMVEPTETESRETLDAVIRVMKEIHEEAVRDPESIKASPKRAPIGRPDEVEAARNPVIRYRF